MELTKLKGNTWIIAGPVNIGIYVKENEAVLIDSGNDASAARKILRLLEAQNWKLRWIVNTHSHADHIGGNAFLQKRTGCEIAASVLEAPFIAHPELEPMLLWSGNAPAGLRNKFLQAEPSVITRNFDDGETLDAFGLQAMALSGHMPGQIGVRTPDDILFTADAMLAERILEKYGIPFVAHYEAAIATLAALCKMEAALFVPSHGEPAKNIKKLADANRACLSALRDDLLDICATAPTTRDDALKTLINRRGLSMNLEQYALIFSTISSVLTSLIDSGEIECDFSTGTLLLSKIKKNDA